MPSDIADQVVPFVTLPLGAPEESVTGSLNLEKVLQDQQCQFQDGLLAKAHEGVLYVDEVNLLPDHLVDILLDVSASGINVVEREGLSHTHDARFIPLGTMNPDEGELRPQLQDRFGLAVHLTQAYSVEERVNIVRQREQFDHDPAAFMAGGTRASALAFENCAGRAATADWVLSNGERRLHNDASTRR